MKWTLFVLPVLALAQQPELKELPKIELFPPGGIHSMVPHKKMLIRPVGKVQVEPMDGPCSVPLTKVQPQRADGVIRVVPMDRQGVAMPAIAVPAPSCMK